MKRIVFFICIFVFLFLSGISYAHINGQSIFKINGVNTTVAPAQNMTSIDDLQDIVPEEYAVNQKLDFAIDISKFPTPKSIFDKTQFTWDFGDGSEKQILINGTDNTHTYTKKGIYTLTVYADYSTAGFTLPPQLLQSVSIPVGQEKQSQSILHVLTGGAISIVVITAMLIFYKKYYKKGRKKHF